MNAVTSLQNSYDGHIPTDQMARAIAEDATRAGDPAAARQSDIAMYRGIIAHDRENVRHKIAEARKGSNPYSRDGIKAHLRNLRHHQAELRVIRRAAR